MVTGALRAGAPGFICTLRRFDLRASDGQVRGEPSEGFTPALRRRDDEAAPSEPGGDREERRLD